MLLNAPKGQYQIIVRGMPATPVIRSPQPSGHAAPEVPKAGVAPPVKYARTGNGLTFSVTGGKQTNDLELTP